MISQRKVTLTPYDDKRIVDYNKTDIAHHNNGYNPNIIKDLINKSSTN